MTTHTAFPGSPSPKRAIPSPASAAGSITGKGRGVSTTPVVISLVVLIAAGAGHRTLNARIEAALGQVLKPEKPLSALPLTIGSWEGTDEPVDENTRRIAGDDDFVNRLYRHVETGRCVSLYVGYIGRPRQWLGHRPDVCYRAHGYKCLSQDSARLRLLDGSEIPCFIYEFGSPTLGGPRELVMATYLINGEFIPSLDRVKETNARCPRFSGNCPVYLARIQASVVATGDRGQDLQTLQDFAVTFQKHLLRLLPKAD